MEMKAVERIVLELPGVKKIYHGKVRDVYHMEDGSLIMVASDRICI
jgi:phosphoribosylaminoimidazole-succinocarboxamide synthase